MKTKQFIADVFAYDLLVHFARVGILFLVIVAFALLMVKLGIK